MPITTMKVGFIGLGDPDRPMDQAIASAGFELHIWALRPPNMEGQRKVCLTLLEKTLQARAAIATLSVFALIKR